MNFSSIWIFFGLTLFIDLSTFLIFSFKGYKKLKNKRDFNEKSLSVMVPVHKEKSDNLRKTILSIYEEDYPLIKVIVVGDSDSIDLKKTVKELRLKFSNLIYYHSPDKSKAKKINNVVKTFSGLGDFLYVRDCNVSGNKECIRTMMSYFDKENIAAVTSFGRLDAPKGFLSRTYYYGKNWINDIGRFRKKAQELRNAIFVVCGASTIYKIEILKKIPIPSISKTEDTHYTWVLQTNGYSIRVADDAEVNAPDVDGAWFEGLRNQLKQSYRWYSGTVQCFYIEGRNLNKNKKLCYTTIVPGFIEGLMYSIPLILLPLIIYLNFYWAIGFLMGDTVFSLLSTLIVIPKKFFFTVLHYPQIFVFKYLGAMLFVGSILIVSFQKITRKTNKWNNEWIPLSIKIKREKSFFNKKLSELKMNLFNRTNIVF